MAGVHWNTRNLTPLTSPGLIPAGCIVMWTGSSPPAGWALCNGSNGTPDLRNRFIVGAGGGYAVGATGGSETESHTHSSSGSTSLNTNAGWAGTGGLITHATLREHRHSYSFTAASASPNHLPPYYTLAFIMKLPYTLPADGTHYNTGTPPGGVIPSGAIMIWSGTTSNVPSGWYVCDGQNGTPDLRGRFVRGSTSPGSTGGATTTSHTHGGSETQTGAYGSSHTVQSYPNSRGAHPASHTHKFTPSLSSSSTSNLPPYYALLYIMKA